MKAVVALSGGMDSTGLLVHLLSKGIEVIGVSFDYGQKHRLELERLGDNLKYLSSRGHSVDHHMVDLTSITSLLESTLVDGGDDVPTGHYESEQMKATVVPNRNMMFFSILYSIALSQANKCGDRVMLGLGVHSGDHAIYPDCRPLFYELAERAANAGNWGGDQVQVYLPYISSDKADILRDAVFSCSTMKIDFDTILRNTNTSYAPVDGKASGKTGADVERILAFHEIRRRDPIEYVDGWEAALEYALSQ